MNRRWSSRTRSVEQQLVFAEKTPVIGVSHNAKKNSSRAGENQGVALDRPDSGRYSLDTLEKVENPPVNAGKLARESATPPMTRVGGFSIG